MKKLASALLTLLLVIVLPLFLEAAVSGDPGGSNNLIHTYANPFRKWVRVECPNGLPTAVQLELFDRTGNCVKVIAPSSHTHFVVEQGRLSTGFYTFRIAALGTEVGVGSLFLGN